MVNHEDPPLHSDSYSLVDIDNLPSDFESHFNDNLFCGSWFVTTDPISVNYFALL